MRSRVTDPDGTSPQPLLGYRSNDEWIALLDQVDEMLAGVEALGEVERRQVFALLQGIDAIHREALHRLVRLFKPGVLEQVVTDPAIHTLFGMYDLLPAKEPPCTRVWDFIGEKPDAAPLAAEPATALPHWSPAPVTDAPAPGEAVPCRMEEGLVMLARSGGALCAFDALCPVHGAPMEEGRLSGVSWICPHGPGCVYDVRNGARLGGGPGLVCHPVRLEPSGRILIGFAMPHRPDMPAF